METVGSKSITMLCQQDQAEASKDKGISHISPSDIQFSPRLSPGKPNWKAKQLLAWMSTMRRVSNKSSNSSHSENTMDFRTMLNLMSVNDTYWKIKYVGIFKLWFTGTYKGMHKYKCGEIVPQYVNFNLIALG